MARQIVYVVVRRDMRYNDSWHNWSGAEAPVKAYRTRERAEAVAAELAQQTDPNLDRWGEGFASADPNHVVMEVEVDVPDGEG